VRTCVYTCLCVRVSVHYSIHVRRVELRAPNFQQLLVNLSMMNSPFRSKHKM